MGHRAGGQACGGGLAAAPSERAAVGQPEGALSTRNISEMVEGLVADCASRGLVPAETTPHTLRHTFATDYLKDHPGDLVGLAALLGHSSLETTRIEIVRASVANTAGRE